MSKIQLVVILLCCLNAFGNTLVIKESCNQGDKISLSGECIYYRLCENHNYVTKKCPRKAIDNIGNWTQQIFDPINNECVDKRKLIVSDKCNSYKECIINESVSPIEKWVESNCPSSFHFYELTQKCIESNMSNCTFCLSNLCKNDGICKEDNKKGGYDCFCKPGFKGKNCEIDINKSVCLDSETYFTNSKGEHICDSLSDNNVTICDPNNFGTISITLTGNEYSVYSVVFSPNGQFLASEDYKNIKIWNHTNGQLLRTLTGHEKLIYSVSFSPNGQYLASGSGDNTIKIWNPINGQLLRTLNGHESWVMSVSFSPNGQFLASGSWDNSIKIWNPEIGQLLRTLTGHRDKVISISYSPNGQFLASGSHENSIKIWNPQNGELLRTLTGHQRPVWSVSFSPNSQFLASGSYDNTIKIWNTSNGRLLRILNGHENAVDTVSFSPNGNYLASGSFDNTIKIWNPENGKLLRTLTGHRDRVRSISYSPNGQFLASCSWDRTIKIWNFCN